MLRFRACDSRIGKELWSVRLDYNGARCRRLADAGLLVKELGTTLALMVGFRNILVHDYTRLDPAVVIRVLRTDLDNLGRFRDAVRALL